MGERGWGRKREGENWQKGEGAPHLACALGPARWRSGPVQDTVNRKFFCDPWICVCICLLGSIHQSRTETRQELNSQLEFWFTQETERRGRKHREIDWLIDWPIASLFLHYSRRGWPTSRNQMGQHRITTCFEVFKTCCHLSHYISH